jgi:Protein of unknown function (DUF2827)
MRIGISVLTHAGQNIWENGLGQNVIFLAQCLRQIPFVTSVFLINGGDQTTMPPQVDIDKLGLRLLSAAESANQTDVAIEMAGALDVQWLDHLRALGKKVVFLCAGQPFASMAEASVFEKPGFFLRSQRCDEIWFLPKDYVRFAPMMRVLNRCPVLEAPYLWSPQFLDQRISEVKKSGFDFGYQPRAPDAVGQVSAMRVAIFEPNVSVTKVSTIPMLVCDQAYRQASHSVSFMHVLNTLHMKDHPTMLHLANSLDIVKAHKALFQGRHDFAGYMAMNANAVVSHQWANDQNYLYLDALYGDYPLIHNSPWLKDVGYYYPDFDSNEGAKQLLRAAANHDQGLVDYRQRASRVFKAVDPLSHTNVQHYARLLINLWHGTEAGKVGP